MEHTIQFTLKDLFVLVKKKINLYYTNANYYFMEITKKHIMSFCQLLYTAEKLMSVRPQCLGGWRGGLTLTGCQCLPSRSITSHPQLDKEKKIE